MYKYGLKLYFWDTFLYSTDKNVDDCILYSLKLYFGVKYRGSNVGGQMSGVKCRGQMSGSNVALDGAIGLADAPILVALQSFYGWSRWR